MAWLPAEPLPPAAEPPASRSRSVVAIRRRGEHLPAVATAVVVGVVVAVVAAATLVARHADTHVAAPAAARGLPAPSGALTPPENRIDFVSSQGAGELVMLDWSWSKGEQPGSSYLQIQVEVVATTGQVDYDPDNFQVFDRSGRVFGVAAEGVDGRLLEQGTLRAGESVRGAVAFDLPRGEATLLMSDGTDQTVTALRVPD